MSDRKCQCCAAKERAAEDYNVLTTMTDEIRRMRDAHSAVVDTLRARLAECERERDALRADRDEERLLHARLSKEYHDATRRVCASLAGQVETLTKERDAAIRERDEALASAHGLTLLVGETAAERDGAIQRAARAEGKLRETTYAALAAREQGEADTVARIAAWLDAPSDLPIGVLRGYGLHELEDTVNMTREMLATLIRERHWDVVGATATCTGCGVRLGDAQCGACAGRATVERVVAWLREEAEQLDDEPQDAAPVVLSLARDIESGAWRGKEGV